MPDVGEPAGDRRFRPGSMATKATVVGRKSIVMQTVRRFLEMIRFSHTVFALPFALLSASLAWWQNHLEGKPFRWVELIGILLCMVFARSAAMGFNRLVDRQIDARNPRTAGRHLPAGLLSVPAVIAFCLICAVGFVASTLLFWPNPWPLILSVPVLLFLCGYSYAKRFTWLCHYWLGAALMLSPIAAWIALRGELSWTPVLLASAVFFWVGGFDILYACQDYEFDQQAGLHSIPAAWGVPAALRLAMLSHLCMLIGLVALWQVAQLGSIFLTGIGLVAVLIVWEHALVRPGNLAKVNLAFFHMNAVISLGLLLIGWLDLWWMHR